MSGILNRLPLRQASDGAIHVLNSGAVPDRVENGLPYSSLGQLKIDTNGAITHYHNGIPFTAQGNIAGVVSEASTRVAPGPLPLNAAGRVCFVFAGSPVRYPQGVAMTAQTAIWMTTNAP